MAIRLYTDPGLRNPIMIVGWPGIGNIGLLAINTLCKMTEAEEFGEIESIDFFPPQKVTIRSGLLEAIDFPSNKFFRDVIGTSPMALVASAKSKYMKFADVSVDARSIKGITIGSIGTGSLGHLAMIEAGKQGGWSWTHIPYRGGGPLMNDVLAGHTPIGIGTVFLVKPHVKAGTVRPMAVTGAKRHPSLPDTPTLAETGIRNFEALAYWGVIAPAKTPAAIVNRMNSEVQKALKEPAVAERLSAHGMTITGQGPAEFKAFMQKEIERWRKVVKEHGISAGS